jgi:hypothetical protein
LEISDEKRDPEEHPIGSVGYLLNRILDVCRFWQHPIFNQVNNLWPKICAYIAVVLTVSEI